MRRGTYMKNAVVLTVTGLILRVAGMFLRVYIAGQIGTEGMGVYQLIYTAYSLFITISTAGLCVAATRITADLLAQKLPAAARRAVARLLVLGAGTGIACALALFFLAPFISTRLLVEPRAVAALRILSPSLPFMALSACMRGYFIAQKDVTPNARAQMLEQAVRIALIMLMLPGALERGMAVACAAAVIGNTISEAVSWVFMSVCYVKNRVYKAAEVPMARWKNLLQILLPVAGSQTIGGALRTVENVIVPSCITVFTASRTVALEQFGALKAMAMPVLFFPFSFLATLGTLLLPDIAASFVKKEQERLHSLIRRSIVITLSFSVLAGGLFGLFAQEISYTLYHSNDVTLYLRILGPIMPFMYMESIVDGILKGINQQLATFRYCLADSFIRITLILLLLPRFGIMGFMYVMLVSNIFTSVLNLQRLCRATNFRFPFMMGAIKPIACMALAGVACRFVFAPLLEWRLSQLWWLLAGGSATAIAFLVFLWLSYPQINKNNVMAMVKGMKH